MRLLVRSALLIGILFVAYLALRALPFFAARERASACAPRPCVTPVAAAEIPATATAPQPTAVPSATPAPTHPPAPTTTPALVVVPYGSIVDDGKVVATPTPILRVSAAALVTRYGDSVYPSIDAMPEPLRLYFTSTVEAVSAFFDVRAEDLIALLHQQGGGLRLQVPADQNADVLGVAQIAPDLWNGWASPQRGRYVRDVRLIEQYGGVGFDWTARNTWAAWERGSVSGGSLIGVQADPSRFENGVAALARYLVRNGLTRQRAASDPLGFEAELTVARARLRGTTTPAVHAPAVVASTPVPPSVAAPVLAAYHTLIDDAFGVALSDQDLVALLENDALEAASAGEHPSAEEAARLLFEQTLQRFQTESREAREAGLPLPWPFVYDEHTLAAQRAAVHLLGHTLPPWELEALLAETGGEPEALAETLGRRGDARISEEARRLVDEGLRRSARGLPLRQSEVSSLVLPALGQRSYSWLSTRELREILGEIEHRMRLLPEFRELHGDLVFAATPLDPMPSRILQPFGVPASYQPEGFHTGLDLRGSRTGGRQPPIFAVEDGTVVHAGPLFCDQPRACRGRHAIIIDHGNNIYTIYSHNSEAIVRAGQRVTAGQRIGRQGNEGYSRGPHLHLEVHVGAPYSGDWRQPFHGGTYVDPYPWLPRETDRE